MRTLAFALLALLAFGARTPPQAIRVTSDTIMTARTLDAGRTADAAPRASSTVLSVEGREPPARFVIDASKSDFMVRAFAGGALWFKGHDHFVRPRDFSGEVTLTPTAVTPATLTMRVRAATLEETRDVFTPQQKKIIDGELRDIVLEPDKYPEITFKSTDVRVDTPAGGQFRVKIDGDLSLHGVTRHVTIPAEVTTTGDALRARGEFEISRRDFNVKATSAFHGTVRVRDKLRVIFQIVARQA